MTLHFLWSLVSFLAELPNLLRQLFGSGDWRRLHPWSIISVAWDFTNNFCINQSLKKYLSVEFLRFYKDFDLNDIVKCLRNTFRALKNALKLFDRVQACVQSRLEMAPPQSWLPNLAVLNISWLIPQLYHLLHLWECHPFIKYFTLLRPTKAKAVKFLESRGGVSSQQAS